MVVACARRLMPLPVRHTSMPSRSQLMPLPMHELGRHPPTQVVAVRSTSPAAFTGALYICDGCEAMYKVCVISRQLLRGLLIYRLASLVPSLLFWPHNFLCQAAVIFEATVAINKKCISWVLIGGCCRPFPWKTMILNSIRGSFMQFFKLGQTSM